MILNFSIGAFINRKLWHVLGFNIGCMYSVYVGDDVTCCMTSMVYVACTCVPLCHIVTCASLTCVSAVFYQEQACKLTVNTAPGPYLTIISRLGHIIFTWRLYNHVILPSHHLVALLSTSYLCLSVAVLANKQSYFIWIAFSLFQKFWPSNQLLILI